MAQPVDVERVLDAAAEIVVHRGFTSATLPAIASRARLSEYEVLELFPSTERLFVAMLNREYAGIFRVILDHMDRDPLGGRLSHIYRHTIGAVHERPLARALYLTDPVALNSILRAAYGFDYIPKLHVRAGFIDMMKDAGMVRHDIDSASLASVIASVMAGVSLTAPHEELDRVIQGLAVMLERSADTDAADTAPGKLVFMNFTSSMADEPELDG
ncbi:MAG: TetR/AcrR family transcriptional regulator [Acidobacteria bacterium]|nr:TetR/AcrR family transcriptional regulator [Acidobacteriota bacterium]